MSARSIFAPNRFGHLLAADAVNVSRDPTLLYALILSIVPGITFAIWRGDMDAAALEAFGVENLSRYVLPLVVCLPGFLLSWVIGFLFLEDRDEKTLLAVDITPLGKGGYMGYRVSVTILLTLLVSAITIFLAMPGVDFAFAALLAVLVALEAVAFTFVLPAIARNKVEGLALTKVTNIASLAPLIAIFPSPFRYAAGIVPTYWVGELLQLSSQNYLPMPVIIGLALIVHLAVAALLFRIFLKRVG